MSRFPNIKWSIIWILIHSCSALVMSILLKGMADEFLFIILAGLGIAAIAKFVRCFTLHEPFLINRNLVFWACVSIFSFWLVRAILIIANLQKNPVFYLLMGFGIFCCSQVVQRILFPVFFGKGIQGPTPQSKSGSHTRQQKSVSAQSYKTYLISDLHLGHRSIIRFCKRPFSSVDSMDRAMVKKWNETVKNSDSVYFLGDLTRRGSTHRGLARLNGKIRFIFGNHDDFIKTAKHHDVLTYKGHSFLLVHDPAEVPDHWNGWVIHGHKHNNCMSFYPFINGTRKRINVSAELIDYRPLDIDLLLQLDYQTIKRMDTIHSRPVRKP
jgi:calcineurin-like phosphoesterase family protein